MLLSPGETGSNLLFGFLYAGPGRALNRLSRLEILVDLEEMLDLKEHPLPHVREITNVVPPRIGRWDAEHLVVTTRLVIRNIATARHRIKQPGNVGSLIITSASRGSPSWPSVPSMKP
jgi:hypothetical protein